MNGLPYYANCYIISLEGDAQVFALQFDYRRWNDVCNQLIYDGCIQIVALKVFVFIR